MRSNCFRLQYPCISVSGLKQKATAATLTVSVATIESTTGRSWSMTGK